jgi:hypothetical protein
VDRARTGDLAFLAMDGGRVPEQFGVVLRFAAAHHVDLEPLRSLLADRVTAVPRLRGGSSGSCTPRWTRAAASTPDTAVLAARPDRTASPAPGAAPRPGRAAPCRPPRRDRQRRPARRRRRSAAARAGSARRSGRADRGATRPPSCTAGPLCGREWRGLACFSRTRSATRSTRPSPPPARRQADRYRRR